jgi:hypothetical protein
MPYGTHASHLIDAGIDVSQRNARPMRLESREPLFFLVMAR